jgi:hypothetical protein
MVVCLTFDDGLRSHFTVARPVLLEAGMTGTFFINQSMLENERHPTMTWEEVRELHGVFEVANHGKMHTSMPDMRLSFDEQVDAVPESSGVDMVSFCYPGYHYDLRLIDALKRKGYTHARAGCDRTLAFGAFQRGGSGAPHNVIWDNPYNIQCLGVFGREYGLPEFENDLERIGEQECGVFCFHNVGPEFRRCIDLLHTREVQTVTMEGMEGAFEYSIDARHADEHRKSRWS